MRYPFRGFTLLFFLIYSIQYNAQEKNTFRAYTNLGFNINQISGDSMSGFNYWGLRGGGGAYFMISKKVSANMEINYSMRGASGFVIDNNNVYRYHRAIITNYIELPIILNYHDGNIARFGGGLVVSSLLNSTFLYNKVRSDDPALKNLLKPIDLGIVGSVTFDIGKHFGANMRMVHSILPANKPRPGEENYYHITLSANGIYYF